ncbi:MMPL family transporter [Streptomyces chrestomyceticus]|uniref:MMPL family transporter n=1 Tax=Streptomyces chrestomyceticus TaxID=68185 RepID=UPI00367B546D
MPRSRLSGDVLFILSHHRQQLARGIDPRESAALATGTAGSAVVFAGTTVIIALAALSVIGIPFMTTMGLGAAGAVLIAVLAAITLVPAIAGFAGSRLTPKPGSRTVRRAAHAVGGSTRHLTMGTRWTKWVIAKPLLTDIAQLPVQARADGEHPSCPPWLVSHDRCGHGAERVVSDQTIVTPRGNAPHCRRPAA